ncbi:MAG: hypothetical protein KY432_12390 [Acidobacteria bacterium]|nr:hypothetical protein [Acidobacteriota bacterium]
MKKVAILLVLLASLRLSAQDEGVQLMPVSIPETREAGGSLWASNHYFHNHGGEPPVSLDGSAVPPYYDATALPDAFLLPSEIRANVHAAWDGSHYLVVGNGPGVLAMRVDRLGRVLDETIVVVDDRGEARGIAYDGSNFLVVYVEDPVERGHGSSLYGRRLIANADELVVLDSEPILIARSNFPVSGWIHDADISFGDGVYLVAWSRAYGSTWDVATTRVSPEGSVLGPEVSVWSTLDREEMPSLAFDGNNFFVTWTSGSRIEGAFVDPQSGAVGLPVQVSLTSSDFPFHVHPELAWNGAHYLIAWSAGTDYPAMRIVGTRMTANGEVIDGYPTAGGGLSLPASPMPQGLAEVSWDGRDFVISWAEGTNFCNFDPCLFPNYRLLFTRVSPEGDVADRIPSSLGDGVLHGHASGPVGQSLFFYQRDEKTILVQPFSIQPRRRLTRR